MNTLWFITPVEQDIERLYASLSGLSFVPLSFSIPPVDSYSRFVNTLFDTRQVFSIGVNSWRNLKSPGKRNLFDNNTDFIHFTYRDYISNLSLLIARVDIYPRMSAIII